MCCVIQVTMSSHHGWVLPDAIAAGSVAIQALQAAPIVVALPNIIVPVMRPLRSCWLIQSVMATHATLAEAPPR